MRRRLLYAFIASLLVHLLLLWPDAAVVVMKDTPSALQATFLDIAPPVAAVPLQAAGRPAAARETSPGVSPAPISVVPLPEREPQTVARPVFDAGPPSLESPKSILPPPASPMARSAETEPFGAASSATQTKTAVTGLTGNPPVHLTPAPGVTADGLRRYRLALASQARRFKRYPAQAMAAGWAGKAEVRVEVGNDGQPRNAMLAQSSGYQLLDRAALAMIDSGAARTQLPESLRGKAFVVILPVVFNLDDE